MYHYQTGHSPYQPPECGWWVDVFFNGQKLGREMDFSSQVKAAEFGFAMIHHLMGQGAYL